MLRTLICLVGPSFVVGCAQGEDGPDGSDSPANGNIVWERQFDEALANAALIPAADDVLVVVTEEGSLVALGPEDGAEIWSDEVERSAQLTWAVHLPAPDRLYLPDGAGASTFDVQAGESTRGWIPLDNGQESVAITDGSDAFALSFIGLDYGLAWSCPHGDGKSCSTHVYIGDSFQTAPAPNGDTLVVITSTDIMQTREKVNNDPSEVDWTAPLGFAPEHAPLLADGYAIVTSRDGEVAAFDTTDGSEVWTFDAETRTEGPAVVDEKAGLVLIAGNDGVIHALTLRGGVQRWSHSLQDAVLGGMTVGDDTVYAASADGMLHAFELEEGNVRWSADLGVQLVARPAVFGTSVVVADGQGGVFRVEGPGQ